eukprot:NODE_2582_length_1162_cov_18.682839_g2361_i0.p1 GENE.NODE_2582_length_1162_cov_18.682839_g2361_i0~~NODE_2582_length_1162_cov_18.682839_g2361_i0.p1  ORF type:complete len:318 (+),score=46.47 NODE_2582_length_1162_cov_18.682839_g2361_i0:106-954(+)
MTQRIASHHICPSDLFSHSPYRWSCDICCPFPTSASCPAAMAAHHHQARLPVVGRSTGEVDGQPEASTPRSRASSSDGLSPSNDGLSSSSCSTPGTPDDGQRRVEPSQARAPSGSGRQYVVCRRQASGQATEACGGLKPHHGSLQLHSGDTNSDAKNVKIGARTERERGEKPRPGHHREKATVDVTRYKTQLCRRFEQTGVCRFEATCCFAHGAAELRITADNKAILQTLPVNVDEAPSGTSELGSEGARLRHSMVAILECNAKRERKRHQQHSELPINIAV